MPRRQFFGVDPNASYDPGQALGMIEGPAGQPLSGDLLNQAKTLAGWSGTGPISGSGLNTALQAAAGYFPDSEFVAWNGGGGSPAPTPAAPPPTAPPATSAPGAFGAFPPITAGTFTRLDPNTAYDPEGAKSYLSTMIGQPIDPYLQEAISIAQAAGWPGGDAPLLGNYINAVIAEAQRRMSGGSAPPPTPPPPPVGGAPSAGLPGRNGNPGFIDTGEIGDLQGDVMPPPKDDLSLGITGRLLDLLDYEGTTATGDEVIRRLLGLVDSGGYLVNERGQRPTPTAQEGLLTTVQQILANGGRLPTDTRMQQFESARELMEKGRRTATTQMRADLADRNLLSEPGIGQGVEANAILRTNERLGSDFATALRDIGVAQAQQDSERFGQALSAGTDLAGGIDTFRQVDRQAIDSRMLTAIQQLTGFASDQARTLLDSVRAGTDRQNVLSQIALDSLKENNDWNQFLAEFGLDRQKVMYEIEQGNIQPWLGVLNLFMQLTSLSRGGYV